MEEGGVIAAGSLMRDDYHLRGNRARFRVLYSEKADPAIYRRLLDELKSGKGDISHWFAFVKEPDDDLIRCLKESGFRLERTSHVLTREEQPVSPDEWPEGVSIRPFGFGRDEETYAVIRNAAFASLKGSETPLTAADVAAMRHDGDRIPGGIFLLCKDGRDLGLVATSRDPGGDGPGPMLEIGPLAVMPGHQGKGYGTFLLRHALRFGAGEVGLPRAVLCVNAENAPALGLYLREGFLVSEGFSCMRQDFQES